MTADAALAAGHAHDDLVADHQRHAGDRLAGLDGRVVGLPELLSGLRVEPEHLTVEGGEEDPAVVIAQAAGLRAAAGAPAGQLRVGDLGPELPLDEALPGEVERVDVVRLRGDDVHRVADDERRGFVRIVDAELHRPRHGELVDVVDVDLIERAVVPARVVGVRHDPLRRVAGRTLLGDRGPRYPENAEQRQERNSTSSRTA